MNEKALGDVPMAVILELVELEASVVVFVALRPFVEELLVLLIEISLSSS